MNQVDQSATLQPMIEMNNLKKYFYISSGFLWKKKQVVRAVDGITLRIGKGEIVGFVGESGSGKTTLARLVLNLIRPTEGSVILDGVDISRASSEQERRMRREVAVVFQDPVSNLNPRQSVESSITRPLILHGMPLSKARELAREAMELVKMDKRYLSSYPHQLSGGQLQRVAIARALVLKPKVMVLDEPTSALDMSVQAQILNLLLDLQENLKLTYLVITHDLNVIRYVSDRVAVMYLGKLMELGPTRDIIEDPKHPYTRGLVESSPVIHPKLRGGEKQIMSGDIGSLISVPAGCRFSPRCPFVLEKCLSQSPGDYPLSALHRVSCFLFDKDSEKTKGGVEK